MMPINKMLEMNKKIDVPDKSTETKEEVWEDRKEHLYERMRLLQFIEDYCASNIEDLSKIILRTKDKEIIKIALDSISDHKNILFICLLKKHKIGVFDDVLFKLVKMEDGKK